MTPRVVVVTGGTQGVGRGIAHNFLEAGDRVVVCARKPPASPIGEAVFEPLNVRAPDEVDRAIAAVLARWGRLDVWINNAGGSPPGVPPPAPSFGASPPPAFSASRAFFRSSHSLRRRSRIGSSG